MPFPGVMARGLQGFGWVNGPGNLKEEMPDHLDRVTTLRGVAALMVAGGYSLMVFSVDSLPTVWNVSFSEAPGIDSLVTKALLVLFNGNSAATLFFVISGFVLGLSLDRGKGGLISTYVAFVIRCLYSSSSNKYIFGRLVHLGSHLSRAAHVRVD